MQKVIEKILSVQNARGALNKQKIIYENKDDENFKRLLYYALNPLLTYKVSQNTLNQKLLSGWTAWDDFAYNDIYEICELLSAKKAVDDTTVGRVCAFLRKQDDSVRTFYVKLLSKTLKLGVTSRSVNKIIPNLIPEWDVQQAFSIEKYPIPAGEWFTLTQKLNGVRATYYKGRLIARSGIAFEGLDHITEELSLLVQDRIVFDGELTLKNKNGFSDNEAFRIATGIINSDGDKSNICFTIFDAIPTDHFDAGESVETYCERRRLYLEQLELSNKTTDNIGVLPILYAGTDQDVIDTLLNVMTHEDKEGLIANLNTTYKRTRHRGILKIKRFYTVDLPVIKCEEGSGRLSGTLGALVVDYKGNEVRVGSGFSDVQRSWIWEHSDEIIGSICEVKYKEISEDKSTNQESLQFPVFVALRTDKETISYD